MMYFVKNISSRVSSGMRLIKSLVTGKYDIRESAECSPYGYDGNPISDTSSYYANTSINGSHVIVGYVNKNQKAEIGESRMYSTNTSGSVQFNVWLRANGEVLIGTSVTPADYTNFLTKFNELKSGFDTLKTDFNTFVNIYNLHTHSNSGGVTTQPTGTGSPSTASIDSSKATKIKTN